MKTEKKNEVKTKKETELQCMDNSSVSNTRYFVNSSEISKADELLQYLYLEKPKNFQYQLLEGQAIELPLYRERNFM